MRIDAPFCWEDYPVDFTIIGGVIESRRKAKDVNIVVMTAQQPIRTKTEGLYLRVTLNCIGKCDFQAAPGLAVNLNGSNFLTGKLFAGKEEWCVDIGIKRLSAKVRNMQVIPWRILLMSPKRRFGIISARDDCSISTLDLDARRLEER